MKQAIVFLLLICSFSLYAQEEPPGVEDAMAAIYMKEYDRAKEIINSGMDVNQPDRGSYLLHVACYRGNLEIVKLLIEKGADVNIVAEDGSTPLIQAGKGDETGEIVRLLIDKGADVHAKNKLGTNAAFNAIFRICSSGDEGPYPVLDILREHGAEIHNPSPESKESGYTTLMVAANWSNAGLTKYLLEHGADVNHMAKDGKTPLMIACDEGSLEVVKLLVEAGADIAKEDQEGNTALSIAEEEGNKAIVTYLKSKM